MSRDCLRQGLDWSSARTGLSLRSSTRTRGVYCPPARQEGTAPRSTRNGTCNSITSVCLSFLHLLIIVLSSLQGRFISGTLFWLFAGGLTCTQIAKPLSLLLLLVVLTHHSNLFKKNMHPTQILCASKWASSLLDHNHFARRPCVSALRNFFF